MKRLKYIFLVFLMAVAVFLFNMKEEPENVITIAFYNVENLFDTKDDPHANDEDFLPSNHWTIARYRHKLERLAEVISKLGDGNGPEILGLGEVENAAVLADLLNSAELKNKHYQFIHKDCKDRRGIDVALVYKPDFFKPFTINTFKVEFPNHQKYITRDILLVGGTIHKDSIYFLVNHWPSRLGGQQESEARRITVAWENKKLVDSLEKRHPQAKIVVMGDFNDEPHNKSIHEVLNSGDSKQNRLYNPFAGLEREGKGSIKYKSDWELIDQIMVSPSMTNAVSHKYIEASANVFDPDWLHYKENPENGPFRTFSGSKYYGGYSDHFPVYIHLASN